MDQPVTRPASETENDPSATMRWWGRRMLIYNAGLILAGLMALVGYLLIVSWLETTGQSDYAEGGGGIEVIVQGVGYVFYMVAANMCYLLGPLFERLLKPRKLMLYREITFWTGLCVSVLLPLAVPVVVLSSWTWGR